jgi:hypothetical protein
MASFDIGIQLENQLGSSGINVYYRQAGDTAWTNHGLAAADSEEVTVEDLEDNYIYEFRLQNIDGNNPYSLTLRSAYLAEPTVHLTPTNEAVGIQFEKPEGSITSYRLDIYEAASPQTVVDTYTVSSPGDEIEHVFTGLDASTNYTLVVNVIASEIIKPYSYAFATEAVATCPDPIEVTATFNS